MGRMSRHGLFPRQATMDTSNLIPTPAGERYPTTGLQQGGFAILFVMVSLSLIMVCLRIYSRQTMKQFGLGKKFETQEIYL